MTTIIGHDKPPLSEVLEHHGIKGQKWGVRTQRDTRSFTTLTKEERKAAQKNYAKFTTSVLDKKFGPNATLFVDPISEADYKKLSNKDEIVAKGRTLYRTTARQNEEFRAMTYVTSKRSDADIYNVVLAKQGLRGLGGRSYKPTYEMTLKSLETLKSPSEKARVDAFVDLIDTPSIVLKNGKTMTGRQWLKNSDNFNKEVKSLDAHQLGLYTYKTFLKDQYMDTQLNTAYNKALRDKGFNAISDDNDKVHLADTPLILLNPNGSVKQMSVKRLTADDINRAKSQLKPKP